ncbi:asparagine synthase (glutamine-hydrolyzing) [Pontibacter cellulosilyticus]|uniref:asparagine synthase (glutamine-hydrolyzing) n=1 Tax=Pontibacter cellulosilyticus TaxID=1720253 RepID=A0A923SHK0_9BACT|nr:asparagine synthase (glutamine-hydrolyzing) [Pontibacter cellulosilyticus]MBC5991627.1 asparagine synthase (glutamine-hydrolyzing) [Pontibacter cellulosilyticus]
MCGINGIIGLEDTQKGHDLVMTMNRAIAHRGPDDSGVFAEPNIALGQNRLSIIDLSAAGHQPMLSFDGNEMLIFNGEIYNYRELKQELSDYPYATHTDSEVILAAYKRWGTDCVHHFNGMFAFAIWDKAKQELFIARDRLGIKPLYYYQKDQMLLFSSEIRALLKSGYVPRKIDKVSLGDYLQYQTVHAPQTMVADVFMLLPGHMMLVRHGKASIKQYWSPENNFSDRAASQSYSEVKREVNHLLLKAVERRLVADVPFGAFLSGGIDSSIIVGLMSQGAAHQVKTFSVSFEEEEFSEAKYAAAIARKFKTQHTEIKLRPEDFLELIPAALQDMDHPSGDGPNTFVVSKVTKEAGITMALSGLGGDELFSGYDVFQRLLGLRRFAWLDAVPLFVRRAAGASLSKFRPGVASNKIEQLLQLPEWSLDQVYSISRQMLDKGYIAGLTGGNILAANKVQQIVAGSLLKNRGNSDALPFLSQVSIAEMHTYMQNVLLRDTDQMSMAHALEVRVPFLDYELVEYVLGVPDKFKYPHTPKKLLVDSIGELLPPEIVNRPKMGFTLPWKEWLRSELYSFCEAKLNNLAKRDLLNAAAVFGLWQSFISQDPTVTWARVWYLVVLENWLEKNGIE